MPWSGWTFPFPWRWNALGTAGNATLFETEAGLAACRSVFASVHAPWMLRIDADAGKEEVAARVRKALSMRFPDVIGA